MAARCDDMRQFLHLGRRGVRCSLLLLSLLLVLTVWPVAAISISFTDLSLAGNQEIYIYDHKGELYQHVNTSSSGIVLDPNSSYNLLIQPSPVVDRLKNPATLVKGIFDFLTDNAVYLAMLIFILFALMAFAKRR
jgi:hypothetical protein